MSSSKTLIINCGASHVSVSVFSTSSGALVLEDYATQQLEYNYSVDDGWIGALMLGMSDLLKSLNVSGQAHLIAPGYQLLTKLIKVPHVEAGKQAQIIAFEAQQNIPYPLHEVVWDSQVIADDGIETEVILIAVKSDVVNGFCAQLSGNGIVPDSVQAASILDYNAFRHAYPDASEETTLLINIGARSSNLLFVNESGFFVRNIALGGNSLTQNLADNLGKPFSQAESVKIAYFSGQTSYDSDHPSVQILEKNSQIFQKRLSQEITRSIVNFRRQRSAQAPSRILLTGQGSQLPGLSESLAQTQKVTVEYFDPLAGVQLGKKADADYISSHLHNLSEVVGEAYRLIDPEAVSINLLPTELADSMAFAKKKPILIGAAALLALSTLPPFLHYSAKASAYEEQLSEVKAQVDPLQSNQNELNLLAEESETLVTRIQNLESLVDSKSNWIVFLSDLQSRLQAVKDVWLEELEVDRKQEGKALRLKGRMLIRDYDPDNPSQSGQAAASRVQTLLDGFTESEFIQAVDKVKFDNSNPRILGFNFTLIINPDRPL